MWPHAEAFDCQITNHLGGMVGCGSIKQQSELLSITALGFEILPLFHSMLEA